MNGRKKLFLAAFLVCMALFVNLVVGGMGDENLVFGNRDYENEVEESFYEDYVVVRSEDGRLLLVPKDNMENIELETIEWPVTKSNGIPFLAEEEDSREVSKFASLEEFRDYLGNHTADNTYKWYSGDFVSPTVTSEARFNGPTLDIDADADGSYDYSETNNQVDGVDEGDIVKTDGEYTYIVSRDGFRVFIVDVDPVGEAEIVSTINTGGYIREIYVRGDTLVILGSRTVYQFDPSPVSNETLYYSAIYEGGVVQLDAGKFYYLNYINYQATFIDIFNIEDREEPELLDSHLVKGYLLQSRMIGDHVYVITSQNMYRTFNEYDLPVPASEIFYLDSSIDLTSSSYYMQLTTILSIDITEPSVFSDYRVMLMKSSSTIYVSMNNIFITYSEYNYHNSTQMTYVHRISIDDGQILYMAHGQVEGTLLNRFSMDEHSGHFRMATSIGWRGSHRVYVLDMDLDVVGCVKDIAPNERLYSARFMGDRAYLVTFKKVDPFFVIDLSDPENPEVLGELKIPGYSNYLHIYDENHVIGIGKDTYDMGDFAWYQGVKLSLFDVTDVNNPKEISQYIIGDRGTSSLALDDPHAFLFSREKNLLVIPISLYEINETRYPDGASPSTHGEYVMNGAWVMHISLEKGFELKGIVSHPEKENEDKSYYMYYNSDSDISRSFYIDDVLFTLSNNYLQMNDLSELEYLNRVELPNDQVYTPQGQVMCIYIQPFMDR